MPLRRVMTLVVLSDGRLVIHSAVALGAKEMSELEALGRPAYLLVPNRYHRLDAKGYKERYPELTVLCPRAARDHVAQVVSVDGCYEDFSPRPELRLLHVDGTADREGAMLVRSGPRTSLVFNDMVFNMPHARGLPALFTRYLAGLSGGPRVTRFARLAMVKDRSRCRAHLMQLADSEGLCRILVSHHQVIDERPGDVLRAVALAL